MSRTGFVASIGDATNPSAQGIIQEYGTGGELWRFNNASLTLPRLAVVSFDQDQPGIAKNVVATGTTDRSAPILPETPDTV